MPGCRTWGGFPSAGNAGSGAPPTRGGAAGARAPAWRGGDPSLSHLPADDPELGQLASLHPFPLVLCIPLRKPEQIFGALLCAHTDRAFFPPARIELLQTLGGAG